MRKRPCLALGVAVPSVLLVSFLTGCAIPPSQFSGDSEDRAVQPSEVRVLRTSLAEGETLGRVTSACERNAAPSEEFHARSLHELTCSSSLLVKVLRERASAVGGTHLTELLCVDVPPEYGPETNLCTALVLRRDGELPEVKLSEPESGHQAWKVRLAFVPSDGYRRGAIRASDNVDLLEHERQNEVPMGVLTASCEDCAPRVVEDGLRAIAGGLGVTALVETRCAEDDETTTCSARVVGYEKDPGRVAAAR